jgi:hypothetical protein
MGAIRDLVPGVLLAENSAGLLYLYSSAKATTPFARRVNQFLDWRQVRGRSLNLISSVDYLSAGFTHTFS